jgi:hypothetical protein
MVPFLDSLESLSVTSIFRSMRASAWRATSPPPTIDTKSEARSAVDVGISYKRPKPDSDSDGGSANGGVGREGFRKRNWIPMFGCDGRQSSWMSRIWSTSGEPSSASKNEFFRNFNY